MLGCFLRKGFANILQPNLPLPQFLMFTQSGRITVKINKIHHIAIICFDYNQSKNFYVNILKFSIIHETYRSDRDSYKLDLKVSEHDTLELFSFPSPPARPSKPESCGLRHLAFEVENIQENVDYLTSRGVDVEPIRVDSITGKKFTFFKDPDDLPLEIYEM
jgi:glyoxylase I family protein